MTAEVLRHVLRFDRRHDVVLQAVQQEDRDGRLRRLRHRQTIGHAAQSDQRQQPRAEMDDVAVEHVAHQQRRRLRERRGVVTDLFECCRRPRLVDAAVERRRPEVLSHAGAQPLDLRRRHHAIGQRQQDHGDAVVVRRQHEGVVRRRRPELDVGPGTRLAAGAEVAQHARQVVVAAERKHVGDAVRHRRPSGGNHRQPAAEADPHQRRRMIRRELAVRRQPAAGVLDRVGDRRGDLEAGELGDVGGDDGDVAGGDLPREPHQARLVDARRVQPRGQQRRARVSA